MLQPYALPPLRLLTVFDAILSAGSIQKAARALNVTQPAVSQSLKALEEHVGVALLDRSTRPAAATAAGLILQAGLRDGLSRIAAAIEEIHALQQGSEASVTIGCTVGTATYWLMPRLADFYAAHPAIAVNVLTTIDLPEFAPGVDLLIRYGRGGWRDGEAVKLFDERVVPVCSPAIAPAVAAAGGLETATLLHVHNRDRTWLTWDDYFERMKLPENRMQGRSFTTYVQATQAALSGQGVMLGWESNTGDLVREGRLVALSDHPLATEEAFFLVFPASRPHRPAVGVFSDWLTRLATTRPE